MHTEMVRAARGKNVWIVGGGELAGRFHDAELLEAKHYGSAFVALRYAVPRSTEAAKTTEG